MAKAKAKVKRVSKSTKAKAKKIIAEVTRTVAKVKKTTMGYAVLRRRADSSGLVLQHLESYVSPRDREYLILADAHDSFDLVEADGFATRGSATAAINRTLKYSTDHGTLAGYDIDDFVVVKLIG
jgi:hypothetical protein